MKYHYTTIEKISEGIYKDRGSKFISLAYPIRSEDDVKNIIAQLKKQYHDARHHCYAWRIGINNPAVRSNDDGEPANSAGKPILNQIEKYDLTNILIVVIRYFGGTLLGVGGLINAYRSAAEDAIKQNRIIRKELVSVQKINFEYPLMNDVMRIIKENELEILEQQFEIACSLKFSVKLKNERKVLGKFKILKDCKIEKVDSNSL